MVLENRFQLVLNDTGFLLLHQPITRFYSQEAKELVKFGTTIVENIGSIDNSPPERIPHEEYVGKDLAKARLLMPLNLFRLGQRVNDIEKRLINLSNSTTELVASLKTVFGTNLCNNLHSRPTEDQKYIS